MGEAINRFQRNIFVLLLYASAYYGFVIDLAGIKSRTAFYAVFDGMILLLGLLSFSKLKGGLVYILLLFIACFVLNYTYSEGGLIGSLNGFREILTVIFMAIFYNKVFAEGNEETMQEYVDIIKKFGWVFLALQIPMAAYQFIKAGIAGDHVGGSFGAWGSGVLTMSVICMVYFLHLHTTKFSRIAFLYVCLTPLFLNETKVSFILIPMMLLLVRFELKFKNVVLALGGAALFFLLFTMYYSDQSGENNAANIFSADFLNDYLIGDIYVYDDIPRFTKIILAWQMISDQTTTYMFGLEYGLFKGAGTRDSSLAQEYGWLLTGTRPYLFFLLLQGGVMLVTAFLLLIAHVNRYFKALNKFKVFLLVLMLIILVYNDIFRNQTFILLYFFFAYYANSPLYSPTPYNKNNI
jgi:hypothetical protein